jgi:hypothetical protein
MKTLKFAPACLQALVLFFAMFTIPLACPAASVSFDLPRTIECTDVTTPEFARNHPDQKIVEARLRISARLNAGSASDITEFIYAFKTEPVMRIRDYMPNTTLESSVAEDRIEITNAAETSKAGTADAHIAYKPLLLGGSRNQSSKKSETSHYQQITAKDVVLASGTTDREHGVFFRLRPSRTTSLEGGKEFALIATVPRSWRGDECSISCTARATKHSLLSTSLVDIGASQAQVGMYLAGDVQAAATAEEFCAAQETYANLLAKHSANDNVFQTISTQTAHLFKTRQAVEEAKSLENAEHAVRDARQRLEQMAR